MAEPGDPGAPPVTPQRTLAAWRPPSGGTRAESQVRPVGDAFATAKTATSNQGAVVQYDDDIAPPLSTGAVVGQRYVIEKHISSGGFGAVYLASDREIRHHHVALKILHRPSSSEEEREGALRELMLIATVSHPCIVQFKDYGWHEERLWFAMPWYKGQTLDRLLAEGLSGEPMSRKEARPIFVHVAQGLAAMHAASVHHHDIKPENIFLAEIDGFAGGLPVLLDLGIATHRGENPKGLTVEYASPETAAAMLGVAEKPVGAAADVFSLALVLRNALDPSVASPVQTDNVMPILHQRATEPAQLPLRKDLKYLEPHFKRWLSLDPDERPTASELAEELKVLTLPEERREARMRVARRVVPVVIIAALLITGLLLQVRKQETRISAQEKEIAAQEHVQEELRKRSESQLQQLESKASELGSERQNLQEALGIAHKLNSQLAGVNKQNDQLGKRLSKVSGERDAVTKERDSLTTERNQLRDAQGRLSAERDRLVNERATLEAQRDQLDKRVQNLQQEAARLEAEGNKKYEKAARERDEAVARQGELQSRVEKLREDKQELEGRIEKLQTKVENLQKKLEAQAASGETDSATKKPAKKKPKAQ